MTAPSGRGLIAAGATLLLALGGVALSRAFGAAAAPAGEELGPPVVVRGEATVPAASTAGPVPSPRHHEVDDDDEPTVVGPAPPHEVDDDDRTPSTR